MPRILSSQGTVDANSPNREQVWLFLIEITHPSIPNPIRLINNDEQIAVGEAPDEVIYFPIGLEVAIPNEDPDQLPQVTLTISDVDRSVLTALRNVPIQNSPRPEVIMSVVLAVDPTIVEVGPFTMDLLQHTRGRGSLTLVLGTDNLVRRPFPGKRILPQFFPNLF